MEMELMQVVAQYIRIELSVVIVALFIIGKFLKLTPKFKQEWQIPFILLGCSILITIPYLAIVLEEGLNATSFITGIIQAIIIASIPVFAENLIKQFFVKRKEDNN